MGLVKATKFKFDKDNWRKSTVCDGEGLCCVIGQYLLACGYNKEQLRRDAFGSIHMDPYKEFSKLTGLMATDVYTLNDTWPQSIEEKIPLLQEMFEKVGIEMIV